MKRPRGGEAVGPPVGHPGDKPGSPLKHELKVLAGPEGNVTPATSRGLR